MSTDEFDELAGRIQGLADFVLFMAAAMEIQGELDGDAFTARIRRYGEGREVRGGHQVATRRTLQELAGSLDEARANRRAQERSAGTPSH